jgi:hypothetical protein
MNEPQVFSWFDTNTNARSMPIDIKVEASLLEPTLPLSSPPPPLPPHLPTPPPRSAPSSSILDQFPPVARQRSNTQVGPSSSKRSNPYSLSRRNSSGSPTMTTVPAYVPWTSPMKGYHNRHSEAHNHGMISMGSFGSYTARSYDHRPTSSSSLTGAIGDSQQSSASPPSSSKGSPPYHMPVSSDMDWSAPHESQNMNATQSYEHGSASYGSPGLTPTSNSPPYISYHQDHKSSFSNHVPSNLSASSSSLASSYPSTPSAFPPPDHFSPSSIPSRSSQHYAAGSPVFRPADNLETELQSLRKRVRELELINDHARNRIKGLEAELANDTSYATQNLSGTSQRGASSPHQSTPSPMSANFNLSWKARTDARVRLYCSLNRAGNALCAWHDSRRERRAYPPRMAPLGHLNCGCTYEEALFEESLARHGVGSYHPGESVRMDPALRNPLLRLLQTRYGYKDGDFERDPVTGDWLEGEGHPVWEQRAQQGFPGPRRIMRGEADRR